MENWEQSNKRVEWISGFHIFDDLILGTEQYLNFCHKQKDQF